MQELNALGRAHRFFGRTSFYALSLSTLIAFGFLGARIAMARSTAYSFLVWNLFLAWIPYWCATGVLCLVEAKNRPRTLVALLCALWLIFFPNAPYIVTDFKHLFDTPRLTWWYDIGLIIAFAWTGCSLAVVSLRIMQSLVQRVVGTPMSWLFVLAAIGWSGLGVYVGRFLRLNSWDPLFHPAEVLLFLHRSMFVETSNSRGMIGVTLMFSAILLACYVMFVSAQSAGRLERA